jgi:hypothetical protein
MLGAVTALLLGVPRSVVVLLLGAGGLGVATVKTGALGRLRRWHALLLAAVAAALVPWLRRGVAAGLRGIATFVANLVGLATGRLKVADIGGRKTLVEAR